MAAGSRTWPNGLPAPRTVPRCPAPGTWPEAVRASTGQSRRPGERALAPSRPAHGRRARPRRLPRPHGACRAVSRTTARSPGSASRASTRHRQPTCPPRGPGPPVRCPRQGPEPRPRASRRRPRPQARGGWAAARTGGKAPQGTSEVYARYKKGTFPARRWTGDIRFPALDCPQAQSCEGGSVNGVPLAHSGQLPAGHAWPCIVSAA